MDIGLYLNDDMDSSLRLMVEDKKLVSGVGRGEGHVEPSSDISSGCVSAS